MEERRSYCRICAAACGIVVQVDGQRVLRVRGDVDHPASRGYTCSKGRALSLWHHDPGRLDRPRLHGRVVTWPELLDDLATSLGGIVTAHGADAVALYLATGLAYDAAGQIGASAWLATLDSASFYTAATVDNAPVLVVADLVAGHPMLAPVWDPASAGLLLLVGTNPVVSHGYGTTLPDPVRYLREHRSRGGTVWTIDPRRHETAALADHHLSVRPGSDTALLAAVARELLTRGADPDEIAGACRPADIDRLRAALEPYTVARAADAAGVRVAEVTALVDAVRGAAGRLAVLCGTGVTMSHDGVLAEWLRWVLLVLTGSLDRPGGMRFQRDPFRPPRPRPRPRDPSRRRQERPGPASRPELPRVIGQLPVVALADQILAGEHRALVVTGGDPIAAAPEPDRMRRALRSLDVLAVVDVAEGEITQLASHVLPATGQLERADVTLASSMAVRPAVQSTAAVVAAGAERRPVWWMLHELSARMGGDLIGLVAPGARTDDEFLRGALAHADIDIDALLAAGPHGIARAVEHGWVRDDLLDDGCWNIAPPELLERLDAHVPPSDDRPVLAPRREMAWSNAVRYAGTGDEGVVRTHTDDARRAGVTAGDIVTVTGERGRIEATLALDDSVRPGVVSVNHGRHQASPGSLTSAHHDVDPLTTMPRASGVAVRLAVEVPERP
jgi:anaerobic selenocysteine-containing dehydrogenase